MRVPRTFVFVDLSGFTNYTAAFGDDAAGRILGAFRTIVRAVASERGVRIAKWLGDGFYMFHEIFDWTDERDEQSKQVGAHALRVLLPATPPS
ncbi:MAG: hypothetical protein HN783_03635, partial [Ilumatobacter sp.]|nr:hypothetical protein [Ilumatobacter sp.]